METVQIPQLTEKEPADRLNEFYRKLGWDGVQQLEPNLVKLTEDDWTTLLGAEITHAKTVITDMHEMDIHIGVGMMWANIGPSGSGRTPGMVELYSGWVRPWPGQPERGKDRGV
ncbi:MAG: hypothetical protein K6T65_01520 [Peptococcaceae bacterium]|nr:hypothetical protein [Peptococcaceae bacterium]